MKKINLIERLKEEGISGEPDKELTKAAIALRITGQNVTRELGRNVSESPVDPEMEQLNLCKLNMVKHNLEESYEKEQNPFNPGRHSPLKPLTSSPGVSMFSNKRPKEPTTSNSPQIIIPI